MDNRETQKPSWIRTKKGKAMLIATIATLVVVIGIVFGYTYLLYEPLVLKYMDWRPRSFGYDL